MSEKAGPENKNAMTMAYFASGMILMGLEMMGKMPKQHRKQTAKAIHHTADADPKMTNLKWLKTDLFRCGLELEKLTDLPSRLEELIGVRLEITKKTSGEYSNTYFNKRLVRADDAPVSGSDNTPF